MDQIRFSPPGPDPGMYGSDRDAFLRVWQRIMPEDRADCPIAVERPPVCAPEKIVPAGERAADDFPTPEDVPCLGSGGESDRERLQSFIGQEFAVWRAYQLLARRSGQGGRVLAALSSGCRRRAKRLSTALFLISGVRFWPETQPASPPPRSYFGALREHFLAEQDRAGAYRAAAEECRDRCLCALYLDLADECDEHACRIRALLENM